MNTKTRKTIIEAILGYLVFSGALLIIIKVWYPDRFQNTIFVAIVAPIMLLIFIMPIFLAIFFWIKLSSKEDNIFGGKVGDSENKE